MSGARSIRWLACFFRAGVIVVFGIAAPVRAETPPASSSTPASKTVGLDHWAFQPVRDPVLPRSESPGSQNGNPIDRFIGAALAKAGLHSAPPADKRTLIRRAAYDLIGLPPTPEEVERFVADPAPDAYERLLDWLIASPRYGERWGRWWLDIARYADSNGQDENKVMSNAWRYRDWVVRAFDRDLPYDEFIIDQLAGDLLPKAGASEGEIFDRWIATGFLILGPKMLAEQDKPKLIMDIVDEQIDVVGRGLLGLTVGCARCHDHKFDPIPTREYYALAGIFKSTKTMENLDFVSKFNERCITPRSELEVIAAQERAIANRQAQVDKAIRDANADVTNRLNAPLPKDPRNHYSPAARAAIEKLEQERDSLRSTVAARDFALAADEGAVADLPVHVRGSHLNLASERTPRGFISAATHGAVQKPGPKESGRMELAKWIASPDNPLTERVAVNRLWQAHFGIGLVRTADNFGLRGDAPTNPDLLDWLARRFVEERWSVKAMHRLIMTSDAYRQSAESSQAALAAQTDPENRLLWRFPRQRLDAEMIRDSLLAISGRLDRTSGGSIVHWSNNAYVPNNSPLPDSTRRAIYLPIVRDRVEDSLTVFDFANPSVCTASRTPTVVSHQALYFMNGPLVKESAKAFAYGLIENDSSPGARVADAYIKVFGRPPTDEEAQTAEAFLHLASNSVKAASPREAELAAWSAFCQTLFAANEFVYRD